MTWVLGVLAGVLGAISFTHSEGYFVVFMTGNAQRAVLSYFTGQPWLAVSAWLLMVAFVAGVVVASVCRRHLWVDHPHGPTVLTTLSLLAATVVDIADEGWEEVSLDFAPIVLMAFGIGALNTSFVKNGEVSVPLSYVTGTMVKMGQGIERHIAGGEGLRLARLFAAVGQFCPGRHGGGLHQRGRERDLDAGDGYGRVRVDNRLHLFPPGSPRAVGEEVGKIRHRRQR